MPLDRTRTDYVLTILLFVLFFLSFFLWSHWGDMHVSSNSGADADPAFISTISLGVPVTTLFLVYEMFGIFILPGKPRIREINKGVIFLRLKIMIQKKLQEGIDDYFRYKNR